jgi:SAM-dependent methyltransferase
VTSSAEPSCDPEWCLQSRANWQAKPGLRNYYTKEVYDRILAGLRPGRSLEIGSGAMFFADYFRDRRPHDELITTDISHQPRLDVGGVDVHDLPFDDGAFDNVICLHVLHHVARPKQALRELARVLRPGGAAILVEPWTCGVGRAFYKHLHHEGYEILPDPWLHEPAADKDAMDANVALARQLFVDHGDKLGQHVPGLELVGKQFFAGLSYLATGGFRRRCGAPAWLIRSFRCLERLMPQWLMRCCCLQSLYVLQKKPELATAD